MRRARILSRTRTRSRRIGVSIRSRVWTPGTLRGGNTPARGVVVHIPRRITRKRAALWTTVDVQRRLDLRCSPVIRRSLRASRWLRSRCSHPASRSRGTACEMPASTGKNTPTCLVCCLADSGAIVARSMKNGRARTSSRTGRACHLVWGGYGVDALRVRAMIDPRRRKDERANGASRLRSSLCPLRAFL